MVRTLDEYGLAYKELKMSRTDGILEVVFHTDGESLKWSETIHRELPFAFADIANDPENLVVILTGAGSDFCTELDRQSFGPINDGNDWYKLTWEGKRTLTALMEIEVPVIAAINGPVNVHSELLILSDVVLAAEGTWFQDTHLERGSVPGDGMNLAWPLTIGTVRGRYFLMTGQKLGVEDALQFGAVNEIHPRAQLLDRAHEIARGLAAASPLALRSTRVILTHEIKQLMADNLSHGIALEGLAKFDGRFA